MDQLLRVDKMFWRLALSGYRINISALLISTAAFISFTIKPRPHQQQYLKISSFRQSRNKLNMFNLFRLCRKDEISIDIVAETGNVVAKNGNSVEATTFDIVERIVQLVAFDNVAWTLLLVWTGP